ncbi:MAG: PKD domain-containing protein, partial [bacterium]|nr:PKD domain-containing protein [bacterium]
ISSAVGYAAAGAEVVGAQTAFYLNTGLVSGLGQTALTAVAIGATNEAVSSGGGGGSAPDNVNVPGGACYSAPNSAGQAYEGVLNYDGDGVLTCYQANAPGVVLPPTAPPEPAGTISPPPPAPISVSCSGAPGNPYVNQPVTWSSSVTGGSGSYIYEWTGTDDLWNTTPSFTKSYATAGVKQASLSVTDSVSHSTASASCATGADQQGGSATGGGGTGVGVSSCTSSFSASPTTVEQGQSINLAWNVSGGSLCASSCSGLGFSTGGAVSGSTTAVPSPASHSYALSCSAGTYGPPANENATVTVRVPIAVISASPLRVTTGNNTTVTWSSENSSSCVVTKNGISWRTDIGPISVPDPVTTQTVYKIDCANNYGVHVTDSVIVNVVPIFNEF